MFLTVSSLPLTFVQQWETSHRLKTILQLVTTNDGWLRLPRHIRSRSCLQNSGQYLYVKGWEPLDASYDRLLASLARRPYRGSTATFLEHFSHEEQKVPAMLRLQEAESESFVANYLQQKAQLVLGKGLDLPKPLAILKFNREAKEQLWNTLVPYLDEQGVRQCKEILSIDDGAVYIYEQKSSAHRLEDYLSRASWPVIAETYRSHFEPLLASKQWLQLFLFFLYADVLAFHPDGVGMGSPFDVGNLCLSGGVADVGTCLVGTQRLKSEDVREGLKIACECFTVIFEKLHHRNRIDAHELLLCIVHDVLSENPIMKNELVAEFVKTLQQRRL